MKVQILAYILFSLTLNVCGQAKTHTKKTSNTTSLYTSQTKKEAMSDYSPTFDKASSNAKRLMNEDFYFSTIDETAPFDNDDGADTYAGFKEWSRTHKNENPKEYLLEQMDSWDYPKFDIYEVDIKKLTPYLKESTLSSQYMSGIDAAIIAIAFGQLYLEGTVDKDFNKLAKIAIRRQLNPELLALWGDTYRMERELKLKKMLAVLNS
jgi:uncharacterized protein YfeS